VSVRRKIDKQRERWHTDRNNGEKKNKNAEEHPKIGGQEREMLVDYWWRLAQAVLAKFVWLTVTPQ
jgi:hypothetical protein